MRFGPLPLAEAEGALLAHGLTLPSGRLGKGHRLSAADLAALAAAGVAEVVAAMPAPDDLGEDAAAAALAAAVAGDGVRVAAPFTGRANLFATAAGLLVVDTAAVDGFNAVDEAVTLATLAAFAPVAAGAMVGTVKIVPYAVPAATVAACRARVPGPLLRVAPFVHRRIGLVQTTLPGQKPGLLAKGAAVLAERLAALGATIVAERHCPHQPAACAEALAAVLAEGCELAVVIGAAATADRADVVPAAIAAAGGVVERVGMPVDPGNLLVLGTVGATPVIGMPGCARSPKLNGFDWVLQRLAAGLAVSAAAIAAMGVGGLLGEIPSRPQPRAGQAPGGRGRVAAVVLAAGRSTRFAAERAGASKLLADLDGKPVVRHAVEAALASAAAPVLVVVGHQQAAVRAALDGLPVTLIDCPEHGQGLAASLRTGVAALPADTGAVLVCLGDMPRVRPATLDRLIAAWTPAEGILACQPAHHGKRGNPVLWDARVFPDLLALSGDSGARGLLARHADALTEVAVDDPGILLDVDTPADLEAL